LTKFHESTIKKLSENFHVHFTPDFARVSNDNYKYYNKVRVPDICISINDRETIQII
jgi:hypothetical protein